MALSKQTDTPTMAYSELEYPQKGSTTIYGGGVVVCAAADGYAKRGLTATSLRFLGIAKATVVNAGADGAKKVVVQTPVDESGKLRMWKFSNDTGTPLTQADVGAAPYLKDDNTFSGDSTGRTAMGILKRVDGASADGGPGVWVQFPLT